MSLQALQKAGFTNGEIRVYTALLELGETSTGPVIKQSKITGSKVYEILEKLKQKGLVSFVTKEKTKYFQAAPPSRILDYIDKKEKELQDNKEEIKGLLPAFEEKRQSLQLSQSATVFEGWQGLRTVFDLILKETQGGKTYYAMTFSDELQDERVVNFMKGHHQRRIAKGSKVKVLFHRHDAAVDHWVKLKDLQMRFFDHALPVGLFIFGDYVANITFTHKTAFLIKSAYVADSYRRFFEASWKKAVSP